MATEGEPDSGKPGAWSMQNPEMRSGHGRGRIGNGPLKLVGLAVGTLIALMIVAFWPARQPRRLDPIPPDTFFPLGQPWPGPLRLFLESAGARCRARGRARRRSANANRSRDFPVPKAGEEVSLVNELKVVSIIRDEEDLHLPNPTRVKVSPGKPKRWARHGRALRGRSPGRRISQ